MKSIIVTRQYWYIPLSVVVRLVRFQNRKQRCYWVFVQLFYSIVGFCLWTGIVSSETGRPNPVIERRAVYIKKCILKGNMSNETSTRTCYYCGNNLDGQAYNASHGHAFCNQTCLDFFETTGFGARQAQKRRPPPLPAIVHFADTHYG